MIVTTSYDPSPDLVRRAREAAFRLNASWVERGRNSLAQLQQHYGDNNVLLVARNGIQLIRPGEVPFFFHPSMAAIRIKRLGRGETDPLLEAAQANPGGRVLDCTAGLGSDAIVFAFGVGAQGAVTALESEPVLAFMIAEGLATYDAGDAATNEALRRIRVHQVDHLSYMREQPDNSFDIVYFDPMFRKPIGESDSISPLRKLANPEPLSEEAIRHAKRVARKTVVLKEQKDSGEFERLGFRTVLPSSRKLAYGVIHL